MKYKRNIGLRLYYILIYVCGILLPILQAACVQTDNIQTEWVQQGQGVWKISVGRPEKVNLLSELNVTPNWEAIEEIGEASLAIEPEEVKMEVIDGKTYIRFPLDKGEKIYGLGLNFKTVEQRGRTMRLHVDHYGGSDNGRTHAPVPFFVSSKGYGALINSARYMDVWVGTGVRQDSKNSPVARNRNTDPEWSANPYSDNLEFLVPAEGVEIVMFSGKTMLDVVRRYNLYNGGGCLPPKWGLGFWHRVPSLFTDKEIGREVQDFKEKGFPLSVIGLEPGWMTSSYPCTYEWDSTRFANPRAFVEHLKRNHIHANVWMNPYVSPDGELYDKILPYACSHTVWCGIVPDYTVSEAQKILVDHFKKNLLDVGISGYKMDENDGYDSWLWPDVATFPSKIAAEQMRQIYGAVMQKVTTQMYKDENKRTYGLVRSANAGTTSFPYVLYNDYYDHRDFITALVNSSFIGVLWTPEVRASQSSEEWLRRMQTVCFSPLAMLNAWADGTKPWSFPDVEKNVNEIAMLRMQLLPYLYTAFADYAFKGIPPVRAMNLERGYNFDETRFQVAFDGTDNPYALAVKKEVKDQFMVGKSLLVAPLFAGEQERKVVFPAGKWFDFYTGKFAGEGEVITVRPGLDKIPVYVRDGGIIPMLPSGALMDDRKYPLEIRHYGNASAVYELYDDDGETFNYQKGEYTWMQLLVDVDTFGKKTGQVVVPEDHKVWSYNEYTFKYMTSDHF